MRIKENNLQNFDVAVVGSGPAGMMVAIRAAELGRRVVLVEKNRELGRKLLLTGKGRCNITNAEFDLRKLVDRYSRNGKFLFHAFSVFGPKEVMDFFEKLGLPLKIERGKRVFPQSDKAQDVLKVLKKCLSAQRVNIISGAEVIEIEAKNNRIEKLKLKNKTLVARNYIFCTGGRTYPITGSTGDGFKWAQSLGHSIEKLKPALTPVVIKEKWLQELQGLSLKNVELSIIANNKKIEKKFGECLFTHFGLSGPIVLSLSKKIGELLERGKVKLSLDLKPALDFEKLDRRIQSDFQKYQNKAFKNCLGDLLPRKFIPVIVELSGIAPEKQVNKITKKERHFLVKLLKNVEMTAKELLGFNLAIITSGGVALAEINDKTMQSKIINNLFFAGEIIDVDGPTGGFNLQVCWSTGYLAGQSAAQ